MSHRHAGLSGLSGFLVVVLAAAALWPTGSRASDAETLVRDNTDFALDLYGRLAETPGNLFFSPYSISTALAMTYAGARGNTETEMAAALRFTLGQEALHPAFAEILDQLAEAQRSGDLRLHVANSLWPQQGYPLLEDYLSLVKTHYGVAITAVDYKQAAEEARVRINGWVEEQTQERIANLLQPGVLDPLTRLVLVNAIYFKGMWETPFKADSTVDAPFHVAPDRTVQAPLMTQSLRCRYASFPLLDIVELPYAGGGMAMIVLLPKENDGIRGLEGELTAGNIDRWLGGIGEREVLVSLPRFKMSAMFRLDDTLSALGMKDAFSRSKANFSGMDGRPDWLYIGAVVHKAFVEVNEEGTEAAAATAVVMGVRSLPPSPPVFRADHPFVFLIQDKATGSILFAGRMSDPTETD